MGLIKSGTKTMGPEAVDDLGYSSLKDLRLEIDEKMTSFSLCFWVFLPSSTPFPCTILHQLHTKNPLLSLNEDKRLTFSPSIFFNKEASDSSSAMSLAKVPSVVSEEEFPLERWVHLGCEVSSSIIHIFIDGKILAESSLDSLLAKEPGFQSSIRVILSAINEGNQCLDGYVYNAKIIPFISSIKDHVKDPPLRLYVDSSATDIEMDIFGVWSVVNDKESCRRRFSLDVVLLDAYGEPMDKDLEVVASLIYANDRTPVEKSDGEAPLLVTCDGLEFPSDDRPSKLLHGRASFKLEISQLSSKCDNKLFCIKFHIPKMGSYPFAEAFSPPIRCISRVHNAKMSTITWKKLPSGIHLVNGSGSPNYGGNYSELQQSAVCAARSSPPSKRVKLGRDCPLTVSKVDTPVERPDEECNSYTVAANKVQSAIGTSLECIQENYGGLDNSASDSESVGDRNSELKNMPCSRDLISDLTVFRYCLGGLSERSHMLKEISFFVSEQIMADLAEQVSFFSGCSHHRYQIVIAKRLLEEGERVWNLISQNNDRVHWDNVVFELEEHFIRIARCSTRSLTQKRKEGLTDGLSLIISQEYLIGKICEEMRKYGNSSKKFMDLNFLRKIAGGHEYMTQDGFNKMWRWLYPVACTISKAGINALWASTSPKWIEGFVTKEEVEYALQNLSGIQEPGTFILRFPTSRSWPHPDAGSLVASYVGKDFSLHHRQLSLDYSSGKFDTYSKSLQELLLSEPELSRVGRMMRTDLTV